jgi:putative intracellular protease/amidase
MARVLFILTSHGQLAETGEDTGFYFGEMAHPWDALRCVGHSVDFASPRGGAAPRTRVKLDDPMDRAFLEDREAVRAIDSTLALHEIDPADYDAVHLPGGHGTMWDFAQEPRVGEIVADVYERGGVVSAICHGPAGLVNARLGNGSYLVQGRRLTSFTDEEERAVGKAEVVPYLLETELRARGADHRKVASFDPHVEVDGRLITGQNPLSARLLANALVEVLEQAGAVASVAQR